MRIKLLALVFIIISCSDNKQVSELTLENTLSIERKDEAVVLTKKQLNPATELLPYIADADGNLIPCQLDDIDADGEWDELAFVYSFQPLEKVTLKVLWIDRKEYPQFVARTNIRFGKLNEGGIIEELTTDVHGKDLPRGYDYKKPYPYQMDGPAWENDKMGFRQYFDGRNCRDVFGKRVTDMVLDTVGIKPNGLPGDTYHVLQEWGRDIMSAANSFGLGGIALQTPDSLALMGVPVRYTKDVIDSTRYTLVVKGPVRSVFRLDYYGWEIAGTRINVNEEVSIWAGKYGYENKVTAINLPTDCQLVTGIVANNNDMPVRERSYNNKLLSMLTFGKQTYNKEFYMGMALILPMENVIQTYDAPPCNSDIQKTWCVKMKPENNEYRYNVYAAWELGVEKFREHDTFERLIDYYALCLNNPIIIKSF